MKDNGKSKIFYSESIAFLFDSFLSWVNNHPHAGLFCFFKVYLVIKMFFLKKLNACLPNHYHLYICENKIAYFFMDLLRNVDKVFRAIVSFDHSSINNKTFVAYERFFTFFL